MRTVKVRFFMESCGTVSVTTSARCQVTPTRGTHSPAGTSSPWRSSSTTCSWSSRRPPSASQDTAPVSPGTFQSSCTRTCTSRIRRLVQNLIEWYLPSVGNWAAFQRGSRLRPRCTRRCSFEAIVGGATPFPLTLPRGGLAVARWVAQLPPSPQPQAPSLCSDAPTPLRCYAPSVSRGRTGANLGRVRGHVVPRVRNTSTSDTNRWCWHHRGCSRRAPAYAGQAIPRYTSGALTAGPRAGPRPARAPCTPANTK